MIPRTASPRPRLRRRSAARVLITGGAGFIGTNLAAALLRQGRAVIVLDSLTRPGTERNLDWLQHHFGRNLTVVIADVRDGHAVRRALDGVSEVYHLAAQVAVTTSLTSPLHDFEVNAGGTIALLEAIRERPEPPSLVFTSTNKVYGAMEALPLVRHDRRYVPADTDVERFGLGEECPLTFHSPYGCSKGTADQYVLDYGRSYGLRTVVFRMSCIYGPHQHGTEDQGWVAHLLRRAKDGLPITLYGDGCQVRDVLYVDDLVRALLTAQAEASRLTGQAFNIGGGPARTISLLELVERLEQLLGRAPAFELAPWRAADQRYFVADHRRFTSATGWTPAVTVDEGLRQLLDWITAESADSGLRRLAVS